MNFLPLTAHISDIAESFWKKAGGVTCWPCDLERAIALVLPLDIVLLSDLTIKRIEEWFHQRHTYYQFPGKRTRLHGCLLVYRGVGFVFIDGSDSKEERLFTLAHEVSHFIVEYVQPRLKACELLGEEIIEVLDGLRPPSVEERIESIMSAINIKPHVHLLEHGGTGASARSSIWQAEDRADELALELVAPAEIVLSDLKATFDSMSYFECCHVAADILTQKFGLPGNVAKTYARQLAQALTGGPSVLSSLGLE
ncbi:hypothetical protein U27_01005 [Candidatus Vecturithrix granuli]|uniref:IrrE N-terminal-like domain-containing protein n=1 Tax=Vecturithrix granuli TaxID=1499967 RepID=A0A081C952_VECG1|nr:hypothetical protein U27_01005 [Candidatus Vecturithrix granuli]